jgi:hypothetical protein
MGTNPSRAAAQVLGLIAEDLCHLRPLGYLKVDDWFGILLILVIPGLESRGGWMPAHDPI